MLTKNEIQLIRSLADKKGRREHGMFVAEGRKMVEEVLNSGFSVERVLGTEGFSTVPGCETVSGKDMERISSLKTPQGIMALVRIPCREMPAVPGGELMLALDGVQDPGNLGTIIRTADWFGIRNVICSPDTADCYNPKVVQSTMGAILRVQVHYAQLPAVLNNAAGCGIPVYGTFMDGENIYESRLEPDRGLLVMGSEGCGIREEVRALITRRLAIPPFPCDARNSESLNVATAAAIACSEFRRRSDV